MQGSRSGLWLTIAKGIRVLQPKLVVLENVSALRRRGLNRVLGDLAGLGYDSRWTSLRASDVGAAHRRERVFILAYNEAGRSILAAANSQHGRHEKQSTGSSTQGTSSPSQAWGFISNCPPPEGTWGKVTLLPTPRARDASGARLTPKRTGLALNDAVVRLALSNGGPTSQRSEDGKA
ncbi:DNA cytosine methyltransferase [Streptomyces sp. NPDC101175]|uniref:DNA cytosine methyltransferase n=1 Tax=Streptomyces sp. NPDC101175 TaxID=3366123 RepID=UPI0038395F6C